jgi:hypothetical protein
MTNSPWQQPRTRDFLRSGSFAGFAKPKSHLRCEGGLVQDSNHSASKSGSDAHFEYGRRASARKALAAVHAFRFRHVSRMRSLALGIIVALAWLAEKERHLPALLGLPIVVFVGGVVARGALVRAWRQALGRARFYEGRLVKMAGSWAGTGETGNRFLDDAHPYARDADVFGAGSLFERLHLAGTPLGEECLASWLRAPAGVDEVRARQAAVAELRDALDLREDLAMLGQQAPARIAMDALTAWSDESHASDIRLARWSANIVALLLGLAAAGFVLGFVVDLGLLPSIVAIALGGVVALVGRKLVPSSLPTLALTDRDLRPFGAMLARLRRQSFTSPLLVDAQTSLSSASLVRLVRMVAARPYRALPWIGRTRLALALETWRQRHGAALVAWLGAVSRLEALNALAAYSYENPSDPYPELLDCGPCFEAEGLGHPLLAAGPCVRNDVRLNRDLRLLIVSGSNMSGKSTLLRAVGANVVLALAGGPVRAVRLRLSPLMLGATLCIQDSLLQGRSRFFAEVNRVRLLLDLAQSRPPLLFLLDELFSGTNSEDRRRGAEAVVSCLVRAGAIGVMTTHDLALTRLAEHADLRAVNIHFTDQWLDGVMTFDYRMRTGVLPSGNGLAIMRAVGIKV